MEQNVDFYKFISGNPKKQNIPSLFDFCLKNLRQNISEINEIGEVPNKIAKKIVKNCSLEDFERIEFCNPDINFGNEKKWRKFTLQLLRNSFFGNISENLKSKSENTTWREFYFQQKAQIDQKLQLSIQKAKERSRKIRMDKEEKKTQKILHLPKPSQKISSKQPQSKFSQMIEKNRSQFSPQIYKPLHKISMSPPKFMIANPTYIKERQKELREEKSKKEKRELLIQKWKEFQENELKNKNNKNKNKNKNDNQKKTNQNENRKRKPNFQQLSNEKLEDLKGIKIGKK
ncbi:transcription elongation factor b polypeptide 3 [Anaeramoeba ignava]|uniref:Transcription elongation factor b polypeptide 3 n=1 Tax=Anaeramoeba ignava TaxID=1746090 RepID=A0A9Q0L6M7_ANAIG|nr:transcription elongation factor b polypeptide 3 [Anaeramoeba ignava]